MKTMIDERFKMCFGLTDEEASEKGIKIRCFLHEVDLGGWLDENQNDFSEAIFRELEYALSPDDYENACNECVFYNV